MIGRRHILIGGSAAALLGCSEPASPRLGGGSVPLLSKVKITSISMLPPAKLPRGYDGPDYRPLIVPALEKALRRKVVGLGSGTDTLALQVRTGNGGIRTRPNRLKIASVLLMSVTGTSASGARFSASLRGGYQNDGPVWKTDFAVEENVADEIEKTAEALVDLFVEELRKETVEA